MRVAGSVRRKSECLHGSSLVAASSTTEGAPVQEASLAPKEDMLGRPASACCTKAERSTAGGQQKLRKSSLNITRSTTSADDSSRLSSAPFENAQQQRQRQQQEQEQHQQEQRQSTNAGPVGQVGSHRKCADADQSSGCRASQQPALHSHLKSTQSVSGVCEVGLAGSGAGTVRVGELERELEMLRLRLERRIGGVKMSKVSQSYLSYFNQWAEYDPFIAQPIPSNPWISDSTELWDSERQTKDVHCRRVRRWAFSLKELLNDPAGREQFHRFLEKEFSAENLK